MCLKNNKIKISCKIKFCKINNNMKIHPNFTKYKICCICYDKINLKNLIRCENEKCVDGYICKKCVKKSNNSLRKCPLCRNESDIFLEKIENIIEILPSPELNINNTEEVKYFNIEKIIEFLQKNNTCKKLLNTFILLIVSFFAGIIVSLLFSQDVTKMNVFIIIFIGIVTIIIIMCCARICCKNLD